MVSYNRRRAWGLCALLAAVALIAACGAGAGSDQPVATASPAASQPQEATTPTEPDPTVTDPPGATLTPTPTPTDETEGAETAHETAQAVIVVTAEVADGVVTAPDRVEAGLGSPVRIEVTSDVHDEVHVHGYDLDAELQPGQTAVIEFTADVPGVFEVELHHGGGALFQLRVQ